MMEIQTERLTLLCLNLEQLKTYTQNLPHLEQELGFPILGSTGSPQVQRALGLKLEKMSRAPASQHAWFTYWLVIVREGRVAGGLVGFKGSPNAQGEVEIGYGMDPGLQGKGYMTEAVKAVSAWALAQPGCKNITAEVLKTNLASRRVMQKAGAQLLFEDEQKVVYQLKLQG